MHVALVDYNSGNLHSASKALMLAGHQTGVQVTVTADPDIIRQADRIVLPGDGAFPACKHSLQSIPGLIEALHEAAITKARPLMGICVGMQLLADCGLEHVPTPGLGWIGGQITSLATPERRGLKIPHMGWNDLQIHRPHPVLEGVRDGDHAYFVHSWQFIPSDAAHLIATVDYGGSVTAIVGRDNIIGMQFHPEKSQALGLQLIRNFLTWAP